MSCWPSNVPRLSWSSCHPVTALARMLFCGRRQLYFLPTLEKEASRNILQKLRTPARRFLFAAILASKWMLTMSLTCALSWRTISAELQWVAGCAKPVCMQSFKATKRKKPASLPEINFRSAMKKKVYPSLDEAVADVPEGARIMFGGFGGAGFPNNLIQALVRKGVKNITAISNNCGTRDGELGLMFKNNQIKHVIASFPGPHSNYFQEQLAARTVTLELVPQGILCERMRAAGAGLQGFYTTVGVGTEVADGKEERVLEGKRCILELPIHADYALIKAQTADELGNLTYRLAARNFNPIMAMAAATTIAEVEEIVPVGSIHPEQVVTPAIFV